MANSVTHAALPYPIKGCRFTVAVPYLDADGDPTDPTTPDTEISKDGAAFADCTEEVTTISGSNGAGYITLTGDELDASLVVLAFKVASGPKATLMTLSPRVLVSTTTGTAQTGAAGSITLASGSSAINDYYNGCIVKTTGGTGGGGGSGSLGNQARVITDYDGSTKVATVVPNWETNPDNTTTYAILLTEVNEVIKKANVSYISDDATAADNAESFFDGTGYAGTNNVIPTVTLVNSLATDAVDSDALAANAVTEIQSGLATSSALATVDNTVDAILNLIRSIALEAGTIGSTGNSTTTLHLEGFSYGDNEIDNYLLVIYDNSAGEYHSRWIESWADTGDIATVPALPFTPEGGVDTYWLTSVRRDITIDANEVATGVWGAFRSSYLTQGTFGESCGGVFISGTVTDATPSATSFDTDLDEMTDDFWNNSAIVFVTGNLAGRAAKITDYDGTGTVGDITVAAGALPAAPAQNDRFLVIGLIE